MKYLTYSVLLCASLLTSAQLMAYGGIVKDGSGNNVSDGFGGCLLFGNPDPSICGSQSSMDAEPVIKEVINLTGVTFKTGSDELNTSSNERLNKSAEKLKNNSDLRVIVAGHTDNVGDAQFNLDLSQKRAESVRRYLVNQGVDGSRLTARGYGDSQPAAPNDTAEGRAQNRRVELRIIE